MKTCFSCFLRRMFHDVVGLVCELHGRGVAHCDLKLDNVLLLDGTPLLSDFSEAVTYADASQAQLHESRCACFVCAYLDILCG